MIPQNYLSPKLVSFELQQLTLLPAKFLRLFASGLVLLFLAWPVAAQTRTPNVPPAAPSPSGTTPVPNILVDPNEDYRLAPGDTIELFVDDAAELSQSQIRLTAAGTFELPFLGVIQAQGKTTQELAKSIAASLREQDYLKQPQVRVSIKQYSSQIFFIQGAVRSPGLYQLEGRPSLLRLISLAGGVLENSGPTALILRQTNKANPKEAALAAVPDSKAGTSQNPEEKGKDSEEDGIELIKVALSPLFNQGNTEQNIRLEPGDIVNIPPAKVFFVAGEVNAPGAFQIKEGTTLRQAISLAQGTTFKAALSRAVIYRDDPETNKRQEILVDVGAVMNGKKQDIALYPNDMVIIPNSRMKSVSSALLSAFGTNAARLPMRY